MAVLLLVGGCAHRWSAVDPLLSRELGDLRRAMASGPTGDGLLLTYEVEAHDGRWRHEIALGPESFAERRTSLDGRGTHAFGVGRHGPWLAVGDGPMRVAPPPWRRLAVTRRALFELGFLRPEGADEALYLPRADDRWEYVYRPEDGRTLTLIVDRQTRRPVGWDVLDELMRLTWCEDVRWVVRHGRYVPGELTCGAINGDGDRSLRSRFGLTSAERLSRPPAWAAGGAAPLQAPCPPGTVHVPIEDERRIELAVGSGGVVVPFVLDSGAWHTYVDASVARELGIVATGEVPHYVEPPWLPAATSWVGVADRLVVEGVPLDGVRVLVMEDLAAATGSAGLLGVDFFRRFVVDLDTPNRVVRLVPHDDFQPPRRATPLLVHGTITNSVMITGEVTDVARGSLILDTGATSTVVVHAPAMAAVRPRRSGSDVGMYYGDMARSPDYLTDVDGLLLGPFAFPHMPAWGRDRDRERLGGGIGLVGMGTLRHLRLSFDVRNRTIYATAGDGYQVLVRAGLELDDGEGGARISRVVPHGTAWQRGVREGDTLTAVGGVVVRDALEARQALAGHRTPRARLTLRREDRTRRISVALASPARVVDELAPPPDRSRLRGPVCPESLAPRRRAQR